MDEDAGPKPAEAPAAASPQAAVEASPGPLTKDQFTNIVLGKTMAEVRAALGAPSNVDSTGDGAYWYYWRDKLAVRDPDSGVTFTSSSVIFDPVSKLAIRVGF